MRVFLIGDDGFCFIDKPLIYHWLQLVGPVSASTHKRVSVDHTGVKGSALHLHTLLSPPTHHNLSNVWLVMVSMGLVTWLVLE